MIVLYSPSVISNQEEELKLSCNDFPEKEMITNDIIENLPKNTRKLNVYTSVDLCAFSHTLSRRVSGNNSNLYTKADELHDQLNQEDLSSSNPKMLSPEKDSMFTPPTVATHGSPTLFPRTAGKLDLCNSHYPLDDTDDLPIQSTIKHIRNTTTTATTATTATTVVKKVQINTDGLGTIGNPISR